MADVRTGCGRSEVAGTFAISVTLRAASGAVEVVNDGRVMFEYSADAYERCPSYDAIIARRHAITIKQARDLLIAAKEQPSD